MVIGEKTAKEVRYTAHATQEKKFAVTDVNFGLSRASVTR